MGLCWKGCLTGLCIQACSNGGGAACLGRHVACFCQGGACARALWGVAGRKPISSKSRLCTSSSATLCVTQLCRWSQTGWTRGWGGGACMRSLGQPASPKRHSGPPPGPLAAALVRERSVWATAWSWRTRYRTGQAIYGLACCTAPLHDWGADPLSDECAASAPSRPPAQMERGRGRLTLAGQPPRSGRTRLQGGRAGAWICSDVKRWGAHTRGG